MLYNFTMYISYHLFLIKKVNLILDAYFLGTYYIYIAPLIIKEKERYNICDVNDLSIIKYIAPLSLSPKLYIYFKHHKILCCYKNYNKIM